MRWAILFLIPLFAQIVEATFGVVWVEPTGNRLNDEVLLNVTVPAYFGVQNCTFTADAKDANQETPILLGYDIKPQPIGTDVDFNLTINTEDLHDSNTWSITAKCYSPDDWGATAFSDITIDNTVPRTPYNLSPESGSIAGYSEIEFTALVNSKRTTYCLLDFYGNHPGTQRYKTDTEREGKCKIKLNVSEGSYEWTMTATDGLNEAISDKQNLQVEIQNPDVKTNAFIGMVKQKQEAYETKQRVQQRESLAENIFIFIIVGVILFIIIKFRMQ